MQVSIGRGEKSAGEPNAVPINVDGDYAIGWLDRAQGTLRLFVDGKQIDLKAVKRGVRHFEWTLVEETPLKETPLKEVV